jgi:hypothetical protein
MNILVLALLVSAVAACGPVSEQLAPPPAGDWRVMRVENPTETPGVVYFVSGEEFETGLTDVQVLGSLPRHGDPPFLVLSGYGCNDCDINRNIYIHSPDAGPVEGESQPRYTYPGTLIEWEIPHPDGEILERSRAFIGTCTEHDSVVVLWITEIPGGGGQWDQSADLVRVEADSLRFERVPEPLRVQSAAVEAVAAGSCREIPPIEQLREP